MVLYCMWRQAWNLFVCVSPSLVIIPRLSTGHGLCALCPQQHLQAYQDLPWRHGQQLLHIAEIELPELRYVCAGKHTPSFAGQPVALLASICLCMSL